MRPKFVYWCCLKCRRLMDDKRCSRGDFCEYCDWVIVEAALRNKSEGPRKILRSD